MAETIADQTKAETTNEKDPARFCSISTFWICSWSFMMLSHVFTVYISIYCMVWLGVLASLHWIRYPLKETRFEPISVRWQLSQRRRLFNTCRTWCADGPDSRAKCVSRIVQGVDISTQPSQFTGCFKSTRRLILVFHHLLPNSSCIPYHPSTFRSLLGNVLRKLRITENTW